MKDENAPPIAMDKEMQTMMKRSAHLVAYDMMNGLTYIGWANPVSCSTLDSYIVMETDKSNVNHSKKACNFYVNHPSERAENIRLTEGNVVGKYDLTSFLEEKEG